ncbi:MAG: hypothetical protein ABSG03_07595 [Bryobacteraceae bacterium]
MLCGFAPWREIIDGSDDWEHHRQGDCRRRFPARRQRLGLLINFHVPLIKDGITRIVNGLEDDDHAKPPSRKEV